MAIDRRTFILVGASAALAPLAPGKASPVQRVHFAAARRDRDGTYSAAIFDESGRDISSVRLPARGHDLTMCPITKRCVAFARRPGNFAIAFCADTTGQTVMFTTPPDRHFYGHGVFSRDGRLLYASENDFKGSRGVIGIYDANNRFARIGEFPTYGMGPHDLALLRRDDVIVVANGGMREHPDFGRGRRVLNAGALQASLVYVDLKNGDLLERHDLAKGRPISLRHLDVGRDDTVVIGAQLEKGAAARTPLVFVHRRQVELSPCTLPETLVRKTKGYISSVAVDHAGEVAALTSSRGAVVLLLELSSGRIMRTLALADVSGIAPRRADGGFLLTSGHGVIAGINADDNALEINAQTRWQWDNHAIMVA